MATETKVRIRRNPYHGFEVWVYGNGELTRRTFDNGHDLMTVLTAECVDDDTLRHAADLFDELDWEPPTYPLGVVYVGEAACDSPVDEPIYPPGTIGHELQRYQPAYNRDWEAAIAARARSEFWKSLCGIATFGLGLAVFSLVVLLGRR